MWFPEFWVRPDKLKLEQNSEDTWPSPEYIFSVYDSET